MNQSFIFGGNTGLSYDQIQKQRDIANELLRANMSTPQNVGEGLSAIGRALAAKAIDKRTSRADEANRKAYEARRDETFSMLGGMGGSQPSYSGSAPNMAGPTPITFTPETANPAGLDPSIISAVDRVAPNQPQQMDASAVGTRLLGDLMRDFNLTQDQAAGVVGNLAHETGGFKHMQEIAPVVPGSRGGFGFAQWTGPRRKAFEAWSAENGLDPTSYEANYGFLQHELKNTPEGAVLGPLSQAQTADQAAQVFSNQFLRPGVPAMGSRQQFAQKFADPQVLMALAGVQGDPYASESDKAIASLLMQQTVQAMDPMRQMEMEKARLELDQMRNPQPGFTQLSAQEVAQLGLPPGVYQRGPDGRIDTIEKTQAPADPIAELRARALAAGLQEGTPEFQQFMLAGGKADNGMVIESDGQGGFRMVQGAGASGAAAKPFTEGQSKDVVYATRAKGALEALNPIANALASRTDVAAGYIPFGFGGALQSEDYQVAKTAGDEFLQAILRKDTGAAITADEQALYGETYLPQPGDNEARLQYKSQARDRAVAAIEAGMSPAQIIAQEKALAEQAGVAEPAPAAQPEAATGPAVADIAKMSLDDLLRVDVNSLTDEQMDAMMKRFDEVNK